MTKPHRQAAHPTVVRAEERSCPCTEIMRLAPIGVKRSAMRHARFAGPEDPSGPGCWTTFLTCPNC
jgi:hypothetical protein